MRQQMVLSLTLLALLAGCSDPMGSPEHGASPPSMQPVVTAGCTDALVYNCGVVIEVYVTGTTTPAREDALRAALVNWNSAVLGSYGLPRFSTQLHSGTAPYGNTMQVTFNGDASYSYYCGSGSSKDVQIYANPGSTCQVADMARSVTGLTGVIAHELGHGIGLQHLKTAITGCVMRVPETGPLNEYPCVYEQQRLYWGYGLRPTVPVETEEFVTGVSISPAGVTLSGGQTQAFEAQLEWSGGSLERMTSEGLELTALVVEPDAGSVAVSWSLSGSSAGWIDSYSSNPTTFHANHVSATQSAVLTVTVPEAGNVVWPNPVASTTISVTGAPPPVTTVTVSPASATVEPNGSAVFSAAAFSNGTPVPGESFTWSVSGPAYIAGGNQGTSVTVVGTSAGTATVTATAGNGVFGSASLTVTAPPVVTSVVVSPGSAMVQQNGSAVFSAAAFSNGTPMPGESFTWSVSGPAYIAGDNQGTSVTVVGTSAGTATVTATAGNGVFGSASLTVKPALLDPSFEVTGSWKNRYYFEFWAPGAAETYTWDFGDGTGTSGPYNFVTHTYRTCGVFRATLTVRSGTQSASSSQDVSVCEVIW